jgi:protein-tyrosine phosphatase
MQLSEIDKCHLYVGSAGCIQDVSRFLSLGFTHALCLAHGLDEDSAVAQLVDSGIQWKYMGITDKSNEDLLSVLEAAIAFIDSVEAEGGKVLVYCFQGKSRSVAVCCAYLMKRAGLSFEKALRRIRLTRPVAEPNIGFSLALLRYGRMLSETTLL